MAQTIEHKIDRNIAYIRLDRPEKGNAITREMWLEVADAIHDADESDAVRSIIVTGNGNSFCAGGDLENFLPKIISGEIPTRPEGSREDMMLRGSSITTPIIAAVNGPCLAGGLEFLQVTDIRVAERGATFGLPEVSWGLLPAGGTHTRLPRQIPYAWAMEIILTGDTFSAEEASNMGLINKVVDEGKAIETAEGYAEMIGENGPLAVQKAKEIVTRGQDKSLEESFRIEEKLAKEAMQSRDAEEGVAAFREKRQPEFEGR